VTRWRETWAEVDLGAIAHNVRVLKPEAADLMAVVKADGYGHGAVPVANAALEAGAAWLGVALVEEGLELRDSGIDAPILVLSELPPGSESAAIAARLTPSLYTREGTDRLAAAAARDGRPVSVHIKIDTGMHRVGVHPVEEAVAFVDRATSKGLGVEAVWTHFASAEDDDVATKEQLARFLESVDALRVAGHTPRLLHAANSAATILYPQAHFDLVRTGVAMYGVEPAPGIGPQAGLRPAMTWHTRVTMVKRLREGERVSYGLTYRLERDATVATIPVGYADGYPRSASSRADVLIGGRRCRVAGTVTMDQTVVDCGDLEVRPGDGAVLLGRQGSEEILAEELAERAGTIGYEIVTRVGTRVPREHRA
jgi:alanine racemase